MKKNGLKIALAAALAAVLLYFFGRSVEWAKVPAYIADVSAASFLILVPGATLHFFTRALRWRVLVVRAKKDVRFWNLVAGNIVGFTVTYALPGRLGEVVKPLYLARKEGLRPGFTIGTVVVERIFDMTTMCLLLGLFLAAKPLWAASRSLAPAAEEQLRLWGTVGVAVAAGFLLAILLLYFLRERAVRAIGFVLKPLPERARGAVLRVLREFIEGLKFFHSAGQLGLYAGLSFVVWFGIMAYYWVFFAAYHVRLPFFILIPFVFLTGVGASIPTPGMVGGFHYFGKLGMVLILGLAADRAVGMTLVVHALQLTVTCLLGYAILAREGLTLFQLRKMGESEKT